MTTAVNSSRSQPKSRDMIAIGWAVVVFVLSLALVGLGLYVVVASPGLFEATQGYPRLVTGILLAAAGFIILVRYGRLLSAIFREGDYARARQTMRIVRQNIAWAIVYNITALPAAALGLVPPWAAAIGMSASSLIVVLNALRLSRFGAP